MLGGDGPALPWEQAGGRREVELGAAAACPPTAQDAGRRRPVALHMATPGRITTPRKLQSMVSSSNHKRHRWLPRNALPCGGGGAGEGAGERLSSGGGGLAAASHMNAEQDPLHRHSRAMRKRGQGKRRRCKLQGSTACAKLHLLAVGNSTVPQLVAVMWERAHAPMAGFGLRCVVLTGTACGGSQCTPAIPRALLCCVQTVQRAQIAQPSHTTADRAPAPLNAPGVSWIGPPVITQRRELVTARRRAAASRQGREPPPPPPPPTQ